MKINRIIALLAMLVLGAGLLSACGGDDSTSSTSADTSTTATEDTSTTDASGEELTKEEYAQAVQDVLTPLGSTLQSLGDEISNSQDPDALASGIGEAEDTISQSVSDLEEITPPAGTEQVQADLIDALNTFSDELSTVREAAENGDTAALQEAALDLPQAAVEFQKTLAKVQKEAIDAGIPINSAGG